tara:strand:+ start:108 stop:530 length:423 start_codon:yes stop_codon:yes gene_type:complete
MDKFLYIRGGTAVSSDQDETSGSILYPLSSFRGMTAGDAAAGGDGVITDDDDRFTMFFLPMSVAPSGTGATASATDDDMDVIVFDVTSGDFDFQKLYREFVSKINGEHSNGLITIFDGVNTADGLTGITAVHQVTKVSSD